MRERLCFGGDKYHTDVFWSSFRRHWNFTWPHDISETYVTNDISGTLQYSEGFRNSLFDLDCWTMQSAFFDQFPEFSPDCPKFEPQVTIPDVPQRSEREITSLGMASIRRRQHAKNYSVLAIHREANTLGSYLPSLARLRKSNSQWRMIQAKRLSSI